MFYGSNCNRKSKLSGLLTEPLNPREGGAGEIWFGSRAIVQHKKE